MIDRGSLLLDPRAEKQALGERHCAATHYPYPYENLGLEVLFKPREPLRGCDFLICALNRGSRLVGKTGRPHAKSLTYLRILFWVRNRKDSRNPRAPLFVLLPDPDFFPRSGPFVKHRAICPPYRGADFQKGRRIPQGDAHFFCQQHAASRPRTRRG